MDSFFVRIWIGFHLMLYPIRIPYPIDWLKSCVRVLFDSFNRVVLDPIQNCWSEND